MSAPVPPRWSPSRWSWRRSTRCCTRPTGSACRSSTISARCCCAGRLTRWSAAGWTQGCGRRRTGRGWRGWWPPATPSGCIGCRRPPVRTRGTVVFGDHMRADPREQEARAGQMTAALRADGVRGVVLSFVDTAGIARIKTVPVARLARAARWGVGMSTVFDVFLSDDTMTATDELGGPDGDLRLVPDLDRLVPLAGQPGWPWPPVDRDTQTGEVWPACPRGFARAMMDRAAVAGLTFDMAIEVEWAVGRGDTADFAPACTGPAYGMTRLIELSDYTRDLLAALEDQGVAVDQLHPEYAGGQFEVSVAAQDLVGAADDSVLVRQTIRAVSQRHGLRTS